jgi:hypothetical protein
MQENCWHSEGVGQPAADSSSTVIYHAVLALSRWPQRTRPGIVTHLTGLPFLDYAITVNVTPVAGRQEVTPRGAGHRAPPRRIRREAPRVAARRAAQEGAQGGGAQRRFRPAVPRDLFAAGVGADAARRCARKSRRCRRRSTRWTARSPSSARCRPRPRNCSSPRGRAGRIRPTTTASSTPRTPTSRTCCPSPPRLSGLGSGRGALRRQPRQSRSASAQTVGGSPQHAVLIGMTGAGKSAFVEDLLFQTADHFSHSLLVEEGFSYKRFTEAMGETPIVIHPGRGAHAQLSRHPAAAL